MNVIINVKLTDFSSSTPVESCIKPGVRVRLMDLMNRDDSLQSAYEFRCCVVSKLIAWR